MVHIKLSGDYAWREDLYERVGRKLNENTKSGVIDGACDFVDEMVPNLEQEMDHPDMTSELVEILSTRKVRLEYRVETNVRINGHN